MKSAARELPNDPNARVPTDNGLARGRGLPCIVVIGEAALAAGLIARLICKNLELVIREMHTRGCVGPTPVCRKVPLVFVFPWIFLGAQKAEVKLAVDFRHRHKKTTEVQRLKIQQNSPHVFAEMGKTTQ